MICKCSSLEQIRGKQIQETKKHLTELKVDGFKWRTIYRCKDCQVFWEEGYTDDRFVGEPYLIKVSEDYVAKNWGKDYLI